MQYCSGSLFETYKSLKFSFYVVMLFYVVVRKTHVVGLFHFGFDFKLDLVQLVLR